MLSERQVHMMIRNEGGNLSMRFILMYLELSALEYGLNRDH